MIKINIHIHVCLCFSEYDVSEVSQASCLQELQCIDPEMDDQAESHFLRQKENESEFKYISGEVSDIDKNASYLNQDECKKGVGMKRDTSSQPLLEMAPMTGM